MNGHPPPDVINKVNNDQPNSSYEYLTILSSYYERNGIQRSVQYHFHDNGKITSSVQEQYNINILK